MYNKCCVVGCDSRRKDVNFYRFPKTEIGLQKWLECMNSDELRALSVKDLKKRFVCQKHFEKRFMAFTKMRSRLRVGAYPTLLLKDSPEATHAMLKPANELVDHNYTRKRPHVDHSYCKIEIPVKQSRVEIDNVEPTATISCPTTSKENIEVASSAAISFKPCGFTQPKTKLLTTEESKFPRICSTPKSSRRQRVIIRKQTLTPNCARLYKEFVKSRNQLKFSIRARRALKFSKDTSFEKLTMKMNPLAKKLLWMQIQQCTKKLKGRRFTKEEKLISLAIMKQSPKCYKFLQKIFILPSKYTLNKMIAGLNIESGINKKIFEAVKKEVDSWQDSKKYCSILFDEVALEAGLTYNKHKDVIDGFVELNERSNEFADHALVFMLRGAVYKWQQPIVFYFCKGATSSQILKSIIKNVVCAVGESGLIPIALVSDQGSAFQSALKSLQEDTRREQIKAGKNIDDVIAIKQYTLSVFYDPPHLIKGIRNNFLAKNIKLDNKIATWNDIIDVYKTDCNNSEMRLMHKLNDEHVLPDKIKKMKVKNCVRAMSKTVAATLSYTAQFFTINSWARIYEIYDKGKHHEESSNSKKHRMAHYSNGKKVSPTLQNTAEVVSFFDDLFDSVNGASLIGKNRGKPLRKAVSENSCHHEFWAEAIKKLKKIKFVDKSGKETFVPSLKNWITTLESFKRIYKFFKSKNIKIMRPRYFNSDPIENFFGQVRAYNFRNNDPTCHVFKNTFRSLLITRFIKFHSENFNCEEDSGDQLLKWKSLFDKNNELDSNLHESSNMPCQSTNLNSSNSARQERLAVQSRAYTTGWVLRKISTKIKCKDCHKDLINKKERNESLNVWVKFKEFKKNTPNLTYPTEYAVRAFGIINSEANKFLEEHAHSPGLVKQLKNSLHSMNLFAFMNCDAHRDIISEHFIMLTLRLVIFNWCSKINKILKGTDVLRLQINTLPLMQSKAYVKYKTKLKNKNPQK